MGNKEQNYFKIKLESSIETRDMAIKKLEHLDIQIKHLQDVFDHDKQVYDDQATHMQNIIDDLEKRIPALEKKIEAGYTHVDLKTGKAYKGFHESHEGRLQAKIDAAKTREKDLESRQKRKLELREKKRHKLKPEELAIVEAEEIRESLQPKDEIESIYRQQQEELAKKTAFYEQEIARLKAQKEELKDQEEPSIEAPEEPEIEVPEPEEPEVQKEEIPLEVESGKVECPECGKFFTKGGAFASHYKSHFNSNGDVNGDHNGS